MDLLVSGDADLLLYPMPLTADYSAAADISAPILDGGLTLLLHKGTYNPPILGFLRPFSWQVRSCGSCWRAVRLRHQRTHPGRRAYPAAA